ncbi:MAG: hypothetical protein K2H85_07130 [Allobaculum sp.]|nr:hypothetical protein [Allobaculum sp.]
MIEIRVQELEKKIKFLELMILLLVVNVFLNGINIGGHNAKIDQLMGQVSVLIEHSTI